MRSRPDRVSGTTSTPPSAASTENSPVQPLSPSFATECSTKTSDGQIESARGSRVVLPCREGAWSDSGAAEIVSALASLRVDAMQHSIGDLGWAGHATPNTCAHNLPSALAYGDC